MGSKTTTVKLFAAAMLISFSTMPVLADGIGMASYYGKGFHGRRAANGERFNMNAMTAAHRSLPFGTRLKVTNLRNGRTVVVRITDRGPFVRGRSLDLSYGAAKAIGMVARGTARVKFAKM